MFWAISRYSNKERAISELPESENRVEKLILVSFLFPSSFRQIGEILCLYFRPHGIIAASFQAFELKLSTQANFDTLISNLKSNFQYDIVMTS